MTRSARSRARWIGRVAAAAVDHDHLDAERAQSGERVERRGDALALVEHRHDDRELRHDNDLGLP